MYGKLNENGKVVLSKTKKDGYKYVKYVEKPSDEYVFDKWNELPTKYMQTWKMIEHQEIVQEEENQEQH